MPPASQALPEGSEPALPVQAETAPEPAEPIAPAPPSMAEANAAAEQARADAHCRGVAAQRAQDGALNGLDEDTQHAVYNGTYSDCMAWGSRHGF